MKPERNVESGQNELLFQPRVLVPQRELARVQTHRRPLQPVELGRFAQEALLPIVVAARAAFAVLPPTLLFDGRRFCLLCSAAAGAWLGDSTASVRGRRERGRGWIVRRVRVLRGVWRSGEGVQGDWQARVGRRAAGETGARGDDGRGDGRDKGYAGQRGREVLRWPGGLLKKRRVPARSGVAEETISLAVRKEEGVDVEEGRHVRHERRHREGV